MNSSGPFAGKEKSFREERLEAIQKKEEEKWKRRSLPSAQNEDGRSGFKSMQVILRCFKVFPSVFMCFKIFLGVSCVSMHFEVFKFPSNGLAQVVVVSLGWCELADEDLTPENSSKAVNR